MEAETAGNRLHILLSEDSADAERLEQLARYLRDDLLELDVEDVTAVPAQEQAPPGARAVDVTQVGALLVSLGSSAAALRQVVATVQEWWGRCREDRPSLRLSMDDDVLELSDASPEHVTQAFDLFVQRHTPQGTSGAPP
ncbi:MULTISPECIES: hypothetical protein [Streptomyces]|uniref:hypothetical protein n=1 Tax=Streptomyces TaxID=1883 RepID=UPI0031E3D02D